MFRNQYDSDVTVWSPQGRLHQVEYAMEAVNLGSATVGLKSKTHAVLIALKRASSELSAYQKKIINIDDHIGITISGLTADARILSRYMRNECLNYKYSLDTYMPLNRLISILGNKMQTCTQRYDRRPFGVGLLVAGYDESGSHIYQTCPSANFYDCKAMSIGARSQSARTYLEKHLDELPSSSLEELIKHGLRALRDTLPPEVDLTTKNVSIGYTGKGQTFKILEEEETSPYLSLIEGEERRGGGAAAAAIEDLPADPLRDDAGDEPRDAVPAVETSAMDTTE
ncbi:proteasome subunit alpha type-1 [Diabrotica virgifera virgifera]|uniref:Proteasome subunit alpha type n=1 Tax=Diabrotica virgifera virgifera TaxID=50390 RepID=A0A6P7F7Z0_DIAVI|nr:proteasome subunit alpha type-1 [Diabrotica virgifera virgifera]